MTAERAPEAMGLEWVVMGLGRVSSCTGGGDGSWTTLRARSVPCGPFPVQDPQNAALGPKGRDFIIFTVKLVKTTKCHLKVSMRPLIVPVSKMASKSHLLIFSDFQNGQPSLTRN